MTEMSKTEIRRFIMQGTFTGKLATVKKDGSSHVVPIWFVLDDKIVNLGISLVGARFSQENLGF
jgi:nitroimidazol reductase NimA-like FMN-containing flavoprotein (pyridoxamine 5'-phosphate oxidase superfamily)